MTMNTARKVLDRLRDYVDPSLDTTYGAHGLHPYPAKFIPQIPADIIGEHTNERHIILDPFCGSGTTLAEAQRLGRRSIGCDSNPIAALVSRAKTTSLTREQTAIGRAFLVRIMSKMGYTWLPSCPRPSEPRLSHWFKEDVIDELAYLRSEISKIEDHCVKQLAECVFSSIIVAVSNQESDTRYAAITKPLPAGIVFSKFGARLERALEMVPSFEGSTSARLLPKVFCADVRTLGADALPEDSVDLVVTSPPYANSYDYYLYHKWRMIWLGFDVRAVQHREIGSRHEHSSKRASIDVFENKMRAALTNIARALKPSKLAYFLVGDSVIAGELIDAELSFNRIAQGSGLHAVDAISYPLNAVTRSFREKASDSCHGGSRMPSKQQRVLVFESVRNKSSVISSSRKSAKASPGHQEVDLVGRIAQGTRLAIRSSDRDRHVHSLARYPSKFVPAIPAWAIENFSRPGDLVMDPFSGSGTTSVEALIKGRAAFGSDVSPFSCLVTRAKTTRVSPSLITREGERLRAELSRLPTTPRLEFELDTFWFPAEHLAEFASIKWVIENISDPALQPFFLTCLASTIRKIGYQDEGQIKVKRDSKKVISGTPGPAKIVGAALSKNVERLIAFSGQADHCVSNEIVECSAEQLDAHAHNVDLIVTSPPYINAMNYPMTHRYENILLGLLQAGEKREHETVYIGTERVKAAKYNQLHMIPAAWSGSNDLNVNLSTIWQSERKRSYIAFSYFERMRLAFQQMIKTLKPGGHLVLVVGRNTIRGVRLNTFEILSGFLADLNMTLVTSFEYEIYKQALRITRHETADLIDYDGVAVFRRGI